MRLFYTSSFTGSLNFNICPICEENTDNKGFEDLTHSKIESEVNNYIDIIIDHHETGHYPKANPNI